MRVLLHIDASGGIDSGTVAVECDPDEDPHVLIELERDDDDGSRLGVCFKYMSFQDARDLAALLLMVADRGENEV